MEAMHCLRSRECFFENNAKMMILCVCNGSTVFFRGGLEWPICPLYRPPCLIHTTHPPPLLKTLKTPFHQPREGKYHSYLQFAKLFATTYQTFWGFTHQVASHALPHCLVFTLPYWIHQLVSSSSRVTSAIKHITDGYPDP